jgi:hypothetical protein
MTMFHVKTNIEHWLELRTGIGIKFLRAENVPILYVLQSCRRVPEENCIETIKLPLLLQNCYRILITVTLKGMELN